MIRILKKLICVVMGITAVGSAFGFSLWGPAEAYQTQTLDYGIRYLPMLPLPNETVDTVLGPGALAAYNIELGGTKNLGQGARLNVPIITYAYDSTFLTYFGAKGEAAIDSAFAVLNGLPRASATKLTSFGTQGNQQVNYTAEALRMLDLKSTILWLMMEHMGLIGQTHTFDLLERVTAPTVAGFAANPCSYDYVVAVRNFDPITYSPSEYVNGTLLTYQIGELCPAIQVGDAMEQTAQAGAPPFSSVATRETLQVGGYYLRITRDDMGGLKYLYRSDQYVNEGLDSNSVVGASISAYNPVSTTETNTTTTTTTTTGFSGLFGGVEKITFVKTPYDSVLGSGFFPKVYHYSIPWVTNGQLKNLNVTRTITQPDIIFTAGNLTFPGAPPFQETLVRSSSFLTYGFAVSVGVGDPLSTPRVITPEMIVTLNNSGQVIYNEGLTAGTSFLGEANNIGLGFLWGSFNGSTNAPIPFPTGTSIEEVEGQVLSAGEEVSDIGIYNPVSSTSTNVTTGQ
jgi:hypothetical protein